MTPAARVILDAHTLESAFQRTITDTLTARGWRWQHARPARTLKGWRTPIAGHAGHPDIVAVRTGADGQTRLLYVELKKQNGVVSPEQQRWLDTLALVPGVEVYTWKPSDSDTAMEVLT